MNKTILAFYLGTKKENQNTEFFDRLICWVTRSRYSHVEVVTQYNTETEVGSCWSSSPRDGGVRWALIDLKKEHWEVFEVDSGIVLQEILDWFNDREGKKYDWLGAFATTLRFLPQIPNRWFCSESVGASLKMSKPARLTPQDLYHYFQTSARRLNP